MAGVAGGPVSLGSDDIDMASIVKKYGLNDNVGHKMVAMRDYSVNPRLRYRTIKSVNGPLVVVDNVKGPRYEEIVQI